MKNHKINLSNHEMNTIIYALEKLKNETKSGIKLWTDFNEDPPEYLKQEYTELNDLLIKLTNPF